MAFMIPVVKNEYHIYPSCPSTPGSRGSSMSSSPTANSSFVSSPRHSMTGSGKMSMVQSPRLSQTPSPKLRTIPKSESQSSLHRFHSKLVDKLRKTFRGKDTEDITDQPSTSSHITVR